MNSHYLICLFLFSGRCNCPSRIHHLLVCCTRLNTCPSLIQILKLKKSTFIKFLQNEMWFLRPKGCCVFNSVCLLIGHETFSQCVSFRSTSLAKTFLKCHLTLMCGFYKIWRKIIPEIIQLCNEVIAKNNAFCWIFVSNWTPVNFPGCFWIFIIE